MTDPQVDAGRELDAEVAEEVFGQHECDGWRPTASGGMAKYCDHDSGECRPPFPGPQVMGVLAHYSTDIEAAWEVVEKLNEMGFYVTVARTTDGLSFCRLMESNNWVGDGIRAGAATAPLAICRCALKAVRADTEGADD